MPAALRAGPRRARRAAGFTLIELMAVVALFALVAAMVAPVVDLGGARAVQREAEELAAAIELARQRAVMTGRVHELVLDLDAGRHRVEWAAPPEEDAVAAPAAVPAGGRTPVATAPPATALDELVPVPGAFGRGHAMAAETALRVVAFVDGEAREGLVVLRFGPDGSADPATIRVGDREGRHQLDVEVEELADGVRIVDAAR
jgi:general secretion pathway protein H